MPADESQLLLPRLVTTGGTPIVDTHTHIASTFETYCRKYPNAQFGDLFSFVRGMYEGWNVAAVVDVWCEAPVRKMWKELADSALTPGGIAEKWGSVEYWFVMGKLYITSQLVQVIHASSSIGVHP
jgi:TatD DNase family protein